MTPLTTLEKPSKCLFSCPAPSGMFYWAFSYLSAPASITADTFGLCRQCRLIHAAEAIVIETANGTLNPHVVNKGVKM